VEGDEVNMSGSADDPEAELAASDVTWLAISETLSNTMRFLDFHTAH
jgi:hypothetical protein